MIRNAIAGLVLVLVSGCSSTQKIDALKPSPDAAAPLAYEQSVSFIHLPVSIKLSEVESQVNKYMTGLIYDDSNISDDDIEMKIWKQAPISIANQNGKIRTVLPLKAQIKYRIGTGKFGVALYDTRDFNLNGKITLLSDVGLTNWKLHTSTKLESLNWSESPSTTIMGKEVAITYLVNPAIALFKSKIEKTIDKAISESMDFKPNVLDALSLVSQPVQMSEEYSTWLRIVPIELYSTAAILSKNIVSLDMGMKCVIETLVGQKPASKFDRDKIVLKPVAKMPDKITANIVAVSTYADASRIMTGNFKGQEFSSGSRKVQVQNVNLWHKDGKLVIALDLTGSLNGTIYLAGFPQYNQQTKEIYFDQLDYAVDTKSALLRTANWLAQGIILKKIQENCRYSIAPNLADGEKQLAQYLTDYSPVPGIYVNGKADGITFDKIQLTNSAIVAFLSIDGKASVTVDGLK